ncbi:universal stress protein [Pseudonocardia bannensis]|uniref:Universal stress protein n=1 Tax=Pseudonocardia bannensis TaxID=630973 RepID=A0A848DF63_9PSEU|nr:universal stress protein [Pseudonocardia bannensis]NMH91226.1 universal stress protein [Pseudonocardia bannensis]
MSTTDGRPVVVGVDTSPSARQAAEWAATEAARRDVPLQVVHVVAESGGSAEVPGWLDDLLTAARKHGAGRVEARVERGKPAAVLLEHARSAGLVVVGGWGSDAFPGMLAGSVALTLVTHATCPVAVVRGPAPDATPRRDGPVVIGVDGSPDGDAALALGLDIAAAEGAGLVAVHTWSDVVPGPGGGAVRSHEDWGVLEEQGREMLARHVAAAQEAHPEVPVEQHSVADRPVRALLRQADAARLIVVGHRGQGGFTGMLLGSTSQVLVQYAPCPVLVVRSDGPPAA